MSNLKAYLAANYMSGPKADAILARSSDPTLKKKRKKPKNEDYIGGSAVKAESNGGGSGILLRDEDEWKRKQDDDLDLEGGDAPVVGKGLATFKKSKSAWNTVGSTSLALPNIGSASPNSIKPDPDADALADPDATTSAPVVAPPKQLTKRKGGLRTAAQLREEEAAIAAEREPSPPPDYGGVDPTQTVHRDASGRIVDIAKLKEEERQLEMEEERKKKEREEWSKGLIQRQAREERVQEERQMRETEFARGREDRAMNRELREVERWNDPAAEFVTRKKKKGPRRPTYNGPFAPNRFGIRPGFRWDGVDRSNGFEKKFFQYQNAAARREFEHNQWSMEDM
ncbi:Pre-mRNA-splicing factor of RES complex-domain-containing protein [Naematelia encephala]|uniref:Pre-mRNA-splicing factor of RES complex-domain-containing protein n=1 Tax=Naematelia encephala TaxID=71784 RepID=A0A1Y2ASP2_9TREE|nr:Pre-mRNA-splicing factor of RES complex-domain-containing protein [Naematelia encephala]